MKTKSILNWVFALVAMAIGSPILKAQTFVVNGSYTGTKTDDRQITGIGFQPDVVFIKGETARQAVVRVSGMAADQSKKMHDGKMGGNRIQNFLTDGFEIGDDDDVNKASTTYYYTAIKTQATWFVTGTYTGDHTHNRAITGLGFRPDFVFTMNDEDDEIILKTTDMSTDYSCELGSSCSSGNKIISLDGSGFTIDDDDDVNKNGVNYYYIAGRNYPTAIKVGSFTGDAIDNKQVTGVGFQPSFLMVKNSASDDGVFRVASMSGDKTALIDANTPASGLVKTFETDGFRLGANNKANKSGATQYYLALNDPGMPLAVNWLGFDVRRLPDGKVAAEWVVSNSHEAISYTLERSTDKKNFFEVSTLPYLGEHENSIRYTTEDEEAPLQTVWYRVRELGSDGTVTYSSVNSVSAMENLPTVLGLTLYPNPTNESRFFIRLNQVPDENTTVKLFDATGRMILFQTWMGKNNGDQEMEVEFPQGLPKGCYLVEVEKNGSRAVERIMVE